MQTEFACEDCGKVFKSTGTRNTHFDKVHLGGKELPCHECGKLFARSGALQVHMKKEHPLAFVNEGEGECNEMSQGMQAISSPPYKFALKSEGAYP